MPLSTPVHIDHVAVAVPDLDDAAARWRDQLGGGQQGDSTHPTFRARQYAFANEARLELIAPVAPGQGFVAAYLDRFGVGVHHLTLKVDELDAAIEDVTTAGLEVVDVDRSSRHWQEAFLRPSQVGGLIVQLAQSPHTIEDFAAQLGVALQEPRPDAARLHGPLLEHNDLDVARQVWSTLGADLATTDSGFVASWGDDPLTVAMRTGDRRGPVGVRMTNTTGMPADAVLGAAVLPSH